MPDKVWAEATLGLHKLVLVVSDTQKPGANECMQGQRLTLTAQIIGSFPAGQRTFQFVYHNGTGYYDTATRWTSDNRCEATIVVPSVPSYRDSYGMGIYASVGCDGASNYSNTVPVTAYRLGIDFFGDEVTAKNWKVCIGEGIQYNALASSNCTNWAWSMNDGRWGVDGTVNQKSGSWADGQTQMWISFWYLSNPTAAKNNDFGDKHGTVTVGCKDIDGNTHTYQSTTDNKKVKVFFPLDKNIDGNENYTRSKPPCWFVFWNQTAAGNSLVEFDPDIWKNKRFGYVEKNLYLTATPIES